MTDNAPDGVQPDPDDLRGTDGLMARADGEDVEGHRQIPMVDGFSAVGQDGKDPDGIMARADEPDSLR